MIKNNWFLDLLAIIKKSLLIKSAVKKRLNKNLRMLVQEIKILKTLIK